MATALLGRQTPRIQVAPPSAFNSGDDAVIFAYRIGVPLDPWQQLALRNGMGRNGDGSWAAFEVCVICQRQNGKGSITDVLELYALFVLGLPVIVHSAHRLETSRKAFRVIKAIIERNPDLARRVKPISPSDEHIETIGGCRLEFRTRTASGGRGLTGDLLVLDEALELNAEQIAAIVPILAAIPGAQLWYTSTVPASAEQHLCKVRASAQANEPRLAYVEWGCDKGVDLADPVAQAEANPAYGTRLSAERLADLRRILGDEKFSTECMGIWPDMAVGAVLDPAQWARLTDPVSRRDGDLVLSLDATPMRDHGTIGLYGERADGLEHVQLVDYRDGVTWIAERAGELHVVLDPLAWVIDGKNGVAALLPELAKVGIKPPEDPERPHRGALMILGAQEAADAVGQFIDRFRSSHPGGPDPDGSERPPAGLRHPGQEPLNAAVKNVRPRPVGDAGQIVWGRKASDIDIGPVVTVTNGRYCFHAWRELITAEYDALANIG